METLSPLLPLAYANSLNKHAAKGDQKLFSWTFEHYFRCEVFRFCLRIVYVHIWHELFRTEKWGNKLEVTFKKNVNVYNTRYWAPPQVSFCQVNRDIYLVKILGKARILFLLWNQIKHYGKIVTQYPVLYCVLSY